VRGISKPWPPRDVYPDGQAQMSLRDAEKAYLAALPGVSNQRSLARSKYEDLDNRKLRREMYREQRSLCIYCERQITEGCPTPRIDHWYPLSRDPGLAMHWRNLYLSCHKLETCDSAKGDHPFRWHDAGSHMPWPVDLRYEDVVGFTSRGEIYVRSDVTLPDAIRRALERAIADRTDGARVRRSIVNLNDPALVKARSAAVRGERKRLAKDFENRTATRDEREERASQLLGRRQLPEFVSIRVASLRKTLGRGR
jgi:uncharacterized protein (TIGR02646 family)